LAIIGYTITSNNTMSTTIINIFQSKEKYAYVQMTSFHHKINFLTQN